MGRCCRIHEQTLRILNMEEKALHTHMCAIEELPIELLLMILHQLPLSATASLAHTNRRWLKLISEVGSIDLSLPGSEFQRAEYMLRWDQDHSRGWLCFACGTYHLLVGEYRSILEPLGEKLLLCPRDEDMYPYHIRFSGDCFHWRDFQRAMHTFRYQPDHGGIDHLNRSYVPADGTGWFRDSLVLAVDDHLLLRHRWTCGIGSYSPVPYFRNGLDAAKLCPHTAPIHQYIFTDTLDIANGLSVENRAEFEEGGKFDRGIVYKIERCSDCPTEIFIEILPSRIVQGVRRHLKNSPRALRITRYVDLGPCNTPEDQEWLALTGQAGCRAEDFTRRQSIAKQFGEDIWDRPIMAGWPSHDNCWREVARLDVERQRKRKSTLLRLKSLSARILAFKTA